MLDTEIALVTGASRGIGRAIADALGAAGATVIGTATSEAGATAITERLRAGRIEGAGMVLDVANPASIETLVNAIIRDFGTPSILVNNAAITRDGLLMRMKDEDWQTILDTDLTSVFRVTRACLRGMMKARKGRIINITSVVAFSGNPGQCNYTAAKAGVEGFTKSLAREVGSRGITVNAVAPGAIDTDMTRRLGEDQRQAMLASIPLGRLGTPEEIAGAVVFLASAAAAYITGETLHVNGGMHMA
jgi:3-oxoacyl-[acyl-carrier protein] reductase